jgi:hypothetical protein
MPGIPSVRTEDAIGAGLLLRGDAREEVAGGFFRGGANDALDRISTVEPVRTPSTSMRPLRFER